MDFLAVVLVLLIYYIRPQDWVPGLIGMGIVTPVMLFAIVAMVLRARNTQKALQFFKTPHDWVMAAYFIFIVYTAQTPSEAFKGALPLFAFYFVTVQALDSFERLRKYLKYWLLALVVIALFGVGSLFGWDPTGAAGMTAANKGRLAIGTWMHNNPNALGHTVILAIPMSYILLMWRKSMASKMVGIVICVLAFECVQATQSKGSFLAGFIVVVLAYAVGRSKIFQILLVTAAIAGSGALLSMLPRMSEMGNLRSDEGVQGRLLAWEMARTASKQHMVSGQGWKSFRATIRWEKQTLPKATHSSYVQIGAELGRGGVFLYVCLLWLGARSLLTQKPGDHETERCRKCLFTLIAAYAISNWMIDRAYHTEFFLFMAAIAAYHRMFLLKEREPESEEKDEPVRAWQLRPVQLMPQVLGPRLAMAGPQMSRTVASGWALGLQPGAVPVDSEIVRQKVPLRKRLPTLIDLGVAVAGTYAIFATWDYILKSMLY